MLTLAYNPQCQDRVAGLLLSLRRNPSLFGFSSGAVLAIVQETTRTTEDLCFMDTKACTECKEVLSLSEYYDAKWIKSGKRSKCKKCSRAKGQRWREQNAERHRRATAYYQKSHLVQSRAYGTKSRLRHRDRERERRRQDNINNPEKYRARYAANNALRSGKLIKPIHCQQCGAPKRLYAHHYDYSLALDVKWLCAYCHALEHEQLQQARRQ